MRNSQLSLILAILLITLILPLASAQFDVKFKTDNVNGVTVGQTVNIPAGIINSGNCALTCFYKIPDTEKQLISNNIPSQQDFKFELSFQVKDCGQDTCKLPIDFICKQNPDGNSCTGQEFVQTHPVMISGITNGNTGQTQTPNSIQSATSEFKGTGFRIELSEKTIDGLTKGSKETTKATIFNEAQTALRCSYKIPGTDEEQSITEGLNQGANLGFNIIFFVPSDCREPCSVSAHISCYNKESNALLGETDVSFDLTGIQSTGGKIFGFVVLFLLVLLVIFIIWRVIKFLRKNKKESEPDEGKRKLSAIMFTDMKGYSKEMGQDEDATLKKVWRYEKVMKTIIQEHDGRIVKTIGDAIMGDFSSAINAVKAAIEIQKLLKKEDIKIRIGIHLGDVIHKGGDIFGDGVNIAARIESICEPGFVYISEDVYSQVKGKIHAGFENLGNRPLKNIESPPKVYKVD